MKNKTLYASLILFFLVCSLTNKLFAQVNIAPALADDETISVKTNLVEMAFIAPFSPNTKYEVFEDGKPVDGFKVISPNDEQRVDWIFYLDVKTKDSPMFGFAPLRRQIKRAAKSLSAPIVIVNLQNLSLKKAQDIADYPDDWKVIGVNGTQEAWQVAGQMINRSSNSRKAFFWMTTEEKEMTRDLLNTLPGALTDKGIFTYITTIRPGKAKKSYSEGVRGKRQQMVGYSNLSLNTQFTAPIGSGLIDYHFLTFMDQCSKLNLIYFQSDSDKGEGQIYGNLLDGVRVVVQRKNFGR